LKQKEFLTLTLTLDWVTWHTVM